MDEMSAIGIHCVTSSGLEDSGVGGMLEDDIYTHVRHGFDSGIGISFENLAHSDSTRGVAAIRNVQHGVREVLSHSRTDNRCTAKILGQLATTLLDI